MRWPWMSTDDIWLSVPSASGYAESVAKRSVPLPLSLPRISAAPSLLQMRLDR